MPERVKSLREKVEDLQGHARRRPDATDPAVIEVLAEMLERIEMIERDFDAVLLAEREACAKIAERDAVSGDWPPAKHAAAEIRARS